MSQRKPRRFESLENRLCLSVSAAVTGGDTLVQGDADGAVEIVAVSPGALPVTDDVRIELETSVAGTSDHGFGDQPGHLGVSGQDYQLAHAVDHGLGTLTLNGRNLGFYYRGFRR